MSGYTGPPLNIPIPDPSEITSREIAKAKAELRVEFEALVASLKSSVLEYRQYNKEIVEAKLGDIARKLVSLTDGANSVTGLVDREVSRVERLFSEKSGAVQTRFDAIKIQLEERDHRITNERRTAREATEAALSGLKEIIGLQNAAHVAAAAKSDSSFTKEMDALKVFINTTRDSTSAEIANLKSRIDRGEGGNAGQQQMQDNSRASSANTIGWVGGGVAVFALVVTIFFNVQQSRAPPTSLSTTRGGQVISEADASQTARLDDLAQRITSLNSRITAFTQPRQPGQ